MSLKNWAGNHRYGARDLVRPRNVDEVRDVVVAAANARALGTRHSFSSVGDTAGTLISTEHLTAVGEPDEHGRVTVGSGISYGELAETLHRCGRALANFASLPHISIGGAVATATHGAGAGNQSLASAVYAIQFVVSDGSVVALSRGDEDFDGAVVSLGALGVVTAVTLETVPAFDLRQYVFEELPWVEAEGRLLELLAIGYSTSLFLSWSGTSIEQAWVKAPEPVASFFGARAATSPRTPILGADPSHCTDQLGVLGVSFERLPHFRLAGIPSAGDELQSEYALPLEHGPAALHALRSIGVAIAPALYVSEIRAVAADCYWLSPFANQNSVTFHFTWRRSSAALDAIRRVEAALAPWRPRPHWAKLFEISPAIVAGRYPQFGAFRRLRRRLDPGGKFANAFVGSLEAALDQR
jgi:alditol oxidase